MSAPSVKAEFMHATPFPGRWRLEAKCGPETADAFFPDQGGAARLEAMRRVVATCSTCPVFTQCREYGIENHWLDGYYGGLSQPARSRIAAKRASSDG